MVITDEMLAVAAEKANVALVDYWEQCPMEEHQFSARFQRKMKRLIRGAKHPRFYGALKQAACLLAVLLLGAAALLSFHVEARAAFVSWMKELWPDRIVYQFFGEQELGELPQYRVTWVPEGYEVVEETYDGSECLTIYANTENDRKGFLFECFKIHDSMTVQYITEDKKYQQEIVWINGHPADLLLTEDENETNDLFWIDEEEKLGFALNGHLDRETLIAIAESVKKVPAGVQNRLDVS